MVVRPSYVMFVGNHPQYNHLLDRHPKTEERRDRSVQRVEDGSVHRVNERDKPNSEKLVEMNSAGRPSIQRLRRSTKLRRKRSAGSERSPDSFVFPDQIATTPTVIGGQKLDELPFVVPNTAGPPPCARGDTFCEAVDEYPSEHVIRLLRKEPVFVRGFFQDEKKQPNSLVGYYLDDVQDRIDSSDENPLCPSQEHIVYPKMAKNIEGNWLFVINQDEYVQGVRVEKCLNDRECSFPGGLPIGYRSQCKQKFIYRKLVALNGTGQGVISDSFQFPSCCSCVIKLDHNLGFNRFGGGGVNSAALPLTLPKTTPTPLHKKNNN